MTTQALLVLLLALLVVVGAVAFHVGDRQRRGALAGRVASVGEALRQVERLPGGRVLLLVLGDDALSLAAGEALAGDEATRRALGAEALRHVVLRRAEGDDQVAGHLFHKYSGQPLPPGACLLLLDRAGLPIAWRGLDPGPLGAWLPRWLEDQPLVGARRTGADAPAGGDGPVAQG